MDKTATILVVDDNKQNLGVISEFLRDEPYQIIIASSGEAALQRLERKIPDMILLDIKMPGIDGIEVCRKLKSSNKFRDIPVVFVTASNDTESITKGYEAGGVDYIAKPVRKAELLARVKTHLKILRMKHILEEQVDQRTKELRENEAKFRSYLENASYGVFVVDHRGKYLDVNPAATEITGYSRDELLNMSIRDLLLPESREKAKLLQQGILSKGRISQDLQFMHKNGDIRHWNISAVTLSENRFLGFVADITERKKAEESLRHSEEQNRSIIAAIPDLFFEFDKDGNFRNAHAPEYRNLAVPIADFIGKNVREILGDELADLTIDKINATLTSQEMQLYEYSLETQGELRDFEVRMVPKGASHTLAIVRDVTERKNAEESLRRSEEQNRSIIAAMPDLFFEFDKNGCFVHAHAPEYSQLAAPIPDFIGKNVREILGDELADLSMENIKATLAKQEMQLYGYSLETHGEIRDFEVRMVPKGETHTLAIVRDVTERKQAEEEQKKLQEQLIQSQKMESVGRLAGGVAHDFNNMLTVILGNSEMALSQMPPDDPLRPHLDEIKKTGVRSADLTRQLLAFARKQTIAPKLLNLNETVSSMLNMLRRLIGEDINLLWKPGTGLERVRIDPAQVDQILANLAVNARDAIGHEVGKITIETCRASFDDEFSAANADFIPGDYVMLAVSDNGFGIDEETRAHIFEPFFTTKSVGKGTGLGLATVYGIVKQNNGFIKLYSEPGNGTTFKIYLPVQSANGTQPTVDKTSASLDARGNETILIVEDELSILKLTESILKHLGYTVLTATTPGEAIRTATEYAAKIHLLITDVVMPEMNGRDLAEKLLSFYPGIKRIFMSGYTANIIAHRGVLDEGVNFIQKPFSKDELSNKVRQTLEKA